MRWSLAFLFLAMFVGGPPLAAARDIFVSNVRGDDRGDGEQPQAIEGRSGPVRTIGRALQLALTGDHLILEKSEEPYRETISLVGSKHSGLPHRDFVIEGNGAILDGSVRIAPEAWTHYRGTVFRFPPPRLGFLQLFLDGKPLVRAMSSRWSDNPPELEPLQWCLHEGFVYLRLEPMKLPDNYHLSYTMLRTGITLYHVRYVTIQDLTVQGFQLDGINAFNSAHDVHLVRVTCRGNGRSGATVGGASLVSLENSLIGDNGTAQLLTLPISTTYLRRSELLSNTAPGWVDQGGQVFLDGKPITGGLDELPPPEPAGESQ